METKVNSNAKRTAIKVSLVAVISLLLLIPLVMIKGVIEDREQTKDSVLEHMDKLGLNRVVYSSLVKGFEPYLEERNLLFYIHHSGVNSPRVTTCPDL